MQYIRNVFIYKALCVCRLLPLSSMHITLYHCSNISSKSLLSNVIFPTHSIHNIYKATKRRKIEK